MIRGYTLVDEYLIGSVLFGGLLAMLRKVINLQKIKRDIWDDLHIWIFLLMIVYMIAQSFRGLLLLESLRKSRWVIYYGMLGVLSLILSNKGFPIPNAKKLSLIVSGSGLIYLISYLAHGLFTELVRGVSRFEVQPGEWSTPAYALYPLVIVIPSAIFVIRERSYRYKWVGWSALVAALLASFYYNCRISLLVMFGFFCVWLLKIKRGMVIFICLSILIFSLFFWITGKPELIDRKTSGLLGEVCRLAQKIRLRTPEEIDLERYIHIRVAFASINESSKSLLFGYGFRTHGMIISPHLKKIYEDMGLPELAKKVRNDESTEAFTALLVDTGLVGMLFLFLNLLFVARKLFLQKADPNRIFLLLSLLFAFLWSPIINMLDIVLFYLLIMPSGLLTQLGVERAYGPPFEVSDK